MELTLPLNAQACQTEGKLEKKGQICAPNPLLSLMTAKARVPADKGKVGRASKVPVREVAFHVLSVL